jgi:hypothetical protein
MTNQSRRGFLAYLGLAGATVATVTATSAACPEPARRPLKGPITPDQYIQEMLAIGWEPFTIVHTLRSGKTIRYSGTFETHPDDYLPTEEQRLRRFELQEALSKSGIDFYQRTGARLFDLGMVQYEDYSQT